MPVEIVEKELSYKIIEVHRQLSPGYFENLYEEALAIELQQRGHTVERQKKIEVKYKDQAIGLHVLDMVVEGRVMLEL
jgi:GxxExxY protein